MTESFDVIILGGGGMGSAAAHQLTKRGQQVLLLEQFEINHQKGSSYGYSRIIRYSYDHPDYIALAKAVYPMWHTLSEEAGEILHLQTGGLDFGPSDDLMLQNTFDSVRAANIPHESLTSQEASKRFPQFRFDDDWKILYQPDSGLVAPSKTVKAQVRLAEQSGAKILANTPVHTVNVEKNSVEVKTAAGTFTAGKIVITAGAWAKWVLAPLGLDLPLTPLRCQEAYFRGNPPTDYEIGRFPVFIAHVKSRFDGQTFYGLPSFENSGVKIGLHSGPPVNHPSEIDYTPDEDVIRKVRNFSQQHIPNGNGDLVFARICLYTMTPDEHFIIDRHPEYPHVVFAAGFSGHGFKFTPLVGSILSDLALEGKTEHNISLFSVLRFSKG